MIVQLGYGVAAAAALLLVRHVARRYPSFPPRAPLGIRFDGRPPTRPIPKIALWFAPAVVVLVVAILGAALVRDPPREDQQIVLALLFLAIAEVAWLIGWSVDRQLELVRKMTFRIAPARMLRAIGPIVVTIAISVILALRT